MKKIFVMLAIAFIVSGAVWAQVPTPSAVLGTPVLPSADPFPEFNAVRPVSTEKRYSAGLFDSDVDNYIDPTFFDGQIGTFMFAGGFPKTETGYVGDTDTLTSFEPTRGKDTISLGFAKTLGNNYLALYYGGQFVNAIGTKNGKESDPDVVETTVRDAVWRNNLAVLFGLGTMGFRFDLIMNDTTDTTRGTGGKVSTQEITDAPTIALSWGTIINDKIAPWVKVGFKFPDTEVATTLDTDGKVDKKATHYTDTRLGLNAGASIDLNDTSSFSADLTVGGQLPNSFKGDVKDLQTPIGASTDKEYTYGGAFGVELWADYTKSLTFGENTTVKFKPNLGLGFLSESNKASYDGGDKVPSNNFFAVTTGIDIGAEYRYDKIALYTGLGLTFFQWATYGYSGGDDKTLANDTGWYFSGLAWDATRFGNNVGDLAFGLTFTPIEGLVFGTGVNVGVFNPATMSLDTPALATASTTSNAVWSQTSMSITVSYKFANKPKAEGTEE